MIILNTARDFLKELKRRNNVFFYLGMGLSALFLIFLVSFAACQDSLSQICHWLKPTKFAFSFAIYVFTLGWYMEYLRSTTGKSKIKYLTWIITGLVLLEILVILLQSWVSSDSYSQLNFTEATTAWLSRNLYLLANTIIIMNTVTFIYITMQFFRKIPLKPISYLWSIRIGLVIFILSSFLGAHMIHLYGQMPPDQNLGIPFTHFSTRETLTSLHFLGIHYLQLIPFTCYFLQKHLGKAFVLSSAGLYVCACLYFII